MQNIIIKIPSSLKVDGIEVSQPLNILIKNSNMSVQNWTDFTIERIPSSSNISMVIKLNQKVNIRDIIIDNNGYRLKVKYADTPSNPIFELLKIVIVYILVYSVITFISSYWLQKISEEKISKITKRLEESDKIIEELKKESEEMRKKTEEAIKNSDKNYYTYNKYKLLLISRINDYSKELNFWKDTIRKLLYNSPKVMQEDMFKLVTKSLKTYQTLKWDENYLDSLDILTDFFKANSTEKKD